ncbi:MAG: SIS domain-containing protein [Clostridia bacterium]|nr:SIS domain-containing protein [Clostridia bacterium]
MKELINRYPALEACADEINEAKDLIINSFKAGGKLLLCGNGGSCADCEHIVGELMKGFMLKRQMTDEQKQKMKQNNANLDDETLSKLQLALPAVSLPGASGLNSAFCNDVDPTLIYAQGVLGLGRENDVLMCISTSGNSANCVAAAQVAKGLGLKVVALTGMTGGKLKNIADVCVCAPETETFKVQEYHLPIYHYICASIEDNFFGDKV